MRRLREALQVDQYEEAFAIVLDAYVDDADLQSTLVSYVDIERKVASVTVQRDTEEAIAWLMARSIPERRSDDLEAPVSLSSVNEPNAAGEWLGSLSLGRDTDATVAHLRPAHP